VAAAWILLWTAAARPRRPRWPPAAAPCSLPSHACHGGFAALSSAG